MKPSYPDIFQNFPYPRLILEAAKDGKTAEILKINQAGCDYFEGKCSEFTGRMVSDALDTNVSNHILQSIKTCLNTGRPVHINIAPNFPGGVKVQSFVLNPIETKDESTTHIDMIALPGETGAQQVERERDDAILLLTSLFDATGVGIVVTDHFGRIVRVNEIFTKDYGWDGEDVIHKEFTMLLPPEERETSQKLHEAFIERGKNGTREIQILRQDGSFRDVWLTTVLLELSQNRRFIVSTLRDITERKNMIRNLRRSKDLSDASNKAKSAFLANMSHELRTPLNAIIGFTEMMRNETFGPIGNEKYQEYLGDVHFSARHLLEIINDVLDMSKIEAGKIELRESEIEIDPLFQSIESIMSDRAKRSDITLEFERGEDVPNFTADMRLVRQMMINLVANAIKFSDSGQTVFVRTSLIRDGAYFRISVEDKGCGISKEDQEHVLEPFGQILDASRAHSQGTGLGLPLTRAMIELHGGEMILESEKDKGTAVHLDFPLQRFRRKKDKRLAPESL